MTILLADTITIAQPPAFSSGAGKLNDEEVSEHE
jgi:hypothetical protein